MVNKTGLLAEENAAHLGSRRPKSAQARTSNQRSKVHSSQAVLQLDSLLEKTVIGNTDTTLKLTNREKEILRLVVAGKTNKEIAGVFSRTVRTVEYHRHRLMTKLGAHNAADLVKKAIAIGII